jgi:hypothetical protein
MKEYTEAAAVVVSPTERSHIVATKTSKTEATAPVAPEKPAKVTARDQGIPEVYLSESGAFKPGYDAKLKSDLIAAILGNGVLHVFNEKEALSVLKARGWESMLEKSRAARERKNGNAA